MSGRILGLDHLGIAVRDPRARLSFWAERLGLPLERVEAVPAEGVRTWFVTLGGAHVELLEPLAGDSPVGRFLEKRGEGLHHVCLAVEGLDALLARAEAAGIAPVGGGVRPGAGGCRVAFLHPRDTGGVLIELSERATPPVAAPAEPAAAERPGFRPGRLVVAYLRDPRERFVGVVRSLDAVGLAVEGLDLDAWEPWVAQWARGEAGPLAPSLQFFPAARIEK
ncbi:MAG: methylmalonyl-CoA epimerase, partial [Acidobacteria bacterium]|nr:methylmalonyl-CoA epimerase [Acidobacteriota bacterium]